MEAIEYISQMIYPPEKTQPEVVMKEKEVSNPVMSFFQKMTIGGYMQIMNEKFSNLVQLKDPLVIHDPDNKSKELA